MTRYHATATGNIQFTAEEEHQADKEEKEWLDTASIRAMVDLREQRDRLLSETDHYALQDVDLTEEMITYRQALRDLPETVDIDNPVFPDKP
jgi:hypothetical protein